MKQNVRIRSEENTLHDATIEVRGPDDAEGNETWVDISQMVQAISWTPKVGDANYVTLRLIPASVTLKGLLSHEMLEVFGEHLKAHGYEVYKPNGDAA